MLAKDILVKMTYQRMISTNFNKKAISTENQYYKYTIISRL